MIESTQLLSYVSVVGFNFMFPHKYAHPCHTGPSILQHQRVSAGKIHSNLRRETLRLKGIHSVCNTRNQRSIFYRRPGPTL